jgi:hypothetical protein
MDETIGWSRPLNSRLEQRRTKPREALGHFEANEGKPPRGEAKNETDGR